MTDRSSLSLPSQSSKFSTHTRDEGGKSLTKANLQPTLQSRIVESIQNWAKGVVIATEPRTVDVPTNLTKADTSREPIMIPTGDRPRDIMPTTRSRGANNELTTFLVQLEKRMLSVVDESSPTGTRPIVSIHALQTYLTSDKVRKLLLYVTNSSINERIVRERYLVVFSVLLSINRGPYIKIFVQYDQLTDERLPFLSRGSWPKACKVIFDEFYEAQWKFCAKRLVYDRLNDTRLHADEIVPFRRKDVLKAGLDSTIFKAELSEEYNYLFPVGLISERAQVQAYVASR
jgi:hypothetical protein